MQNFAKFCKISQTFAKLFFAIFIRVDSASPTNELEPAAAGTSKDPTLYAFLNDYFNKKHRQQTKHLQKDSKQNLMSFLNNYFSSKARSAPAARAHGNR